LLSRGFLVQFEKNIITDGLDKKFPLQNEKSMSENSKKERL